MIKEIRKLNLYKCEYLCIQIIRSIERCDYMKDNKFNDTVDSFDEDYFVSNSAQDCTGLIPSLPQNSSEIQSYEELYNFLPRTVRNKIGEDGTF